MVFRSIAHAAMRADRAVAGFKARICREIFCGIGLRAAGLAGIVEFRSVQRHQIRRVEL